MAVYREMRAPAACMMCSLDTAYACNACISAAHKNYQFLPVAPVAGPARAVRCHAFDVISPLLQEAGPYLQTFLRTEEVEPNSFFLHFDTAKTLRSQDCPAIIRADAPLQAQSGCLCRQCQHACCPAELPLASEYTFAGTREARPVWACGMRSALFHLMGVSGSSADGLQAYRLADRHVGLPGRRATLWARQAWDILGHMLCQKSAMLLVRALQPAAHLSLVLGCHFFSFAWRRGTLMRHLQLPGAEILPSPTVFISSFQHQRLQAIAQVFGWSSALHREMAHRCEGCTWFQGAATACIWVLVYARCAYDAAACTGCQGWNKPAKHLTLPKLSDLPLGDR